MIGRRYGESEKDTMANRLIVFMAVIILAATAFAGVAMSLSQDTVNDAQDTSLGDRAVIFKTIQSNPEINKERKALEAECEQKLAELDDEKAMRIAEAKYVHEAVINEINVYLSAISAAYESYAQDAARTMDMMRAARQNGGDVSDLQKRLDYCEAQMKGLETSMMMQEQFLAIENERYAEELSDLEEEFSAAAKDIMYYYGVMILELEASEVQDIVVKSSIVSRMVPAPVLVANAGEALASMGTYDVLSSEMQFGYSMPGYLPHIGHLYDYIEYDANHPFLHGTIAFGFFGPTWTEA